eukprot:233527-Pleurochrysis_carterae.AAC.1
MSALALALRAARAARNLDSPWNRLFNHVGLGAIPCLGKLGVRERVLEEELYDLFLDHLGQATRGRELNV